MLFSLFDLFTLFLFIFNSISRSTRFSEICVTIRSKRHVFLHVLETILDYAIHARGGSALQIIRRHNVAFTLVIPFAARPPIFNSRKSPNRAGILINQLFSNDCLSTILLPCCLWSLSQICDFVRDVAGVPYRKLTVHFT